MSQRRLSIRIPKELDQRLARAAKKAGKSESEIVRAAIQDYCAAETPGLSAYDLFKKAGMIGDAKGLPSDLATNPKYMEGFGRD
jgi:predicted transcriptional regulator